MIAALALAAAQLLPGSPAGCTGLCDPERLRPWFAKLAARRRGGASVRVLQIGDSHTAGDQVTGAWRTLLQARYGDAGRGLMAAGRPYQGYLTKGVTAAQSAGWSVSANFGAAWAGGAGAPVGVSGFSQTSMGDGAGMTLTADRGTFARFGVCALARPGAGTVTLALGGATQLLALDAPEQVARCASVEGSAAQASLAASGAVTLTSWWSETGQLGVVLSNLGTVGAQLVHLQREDDELVAAEIARARPDLLVVAFGTNEAFVPAFSAGTYQSQLRAGIGRLKRLAPGVPMLVLGAPDSATRNTTLWSGASGTSLPCDDPAWRPTAALAAVQAIQARVAHDEGAAFWSWSAAMGGRCTATRWAVATPPLMRGDRVHFTREGGEAIARALQADLDAAAFLVAPDAVAR